MTMLEWGFYCFQNFAWDDPRWNEATAKRFCRKYIKDEYKIGQMCAKEVPSVNFGQEINTCKEDIQVLILSAELALIPIRILFPGW